jgi:hypothetical protein
MSNGLEEIATGSTAGIPPVGPTGTQPAGSPQSKIQQILKALAPLLGTVGKAYQQSRPQMQPGTPGTIPPAQPAPTVPNVRFDPTGAGAGMQAPVPQPPRPGYIPSTYGGEMMQHLNPRGAATYSAISGVSQFLQDWAAQKDKKQQAEAGNIANNLMKGIEIGKSTGDWSLVQAIMTNKENIKILNKVHKGWLVKAEEAQTPAKAEKKDPTAQGFEQGIQQFLNKGQGQQQGQGLSQQQQGQPQGQGQPPTSFGGYRVPQTSPGTPEAQLSAMKARTEMGALRTEAGALSPEERTLAARAKEGFAELPVQPPGVRLKLAELQAGLNKATLEVQKAQYELKKTMAQTDAAGKRDEVAIKKADKELQISSVRLDIEKQRLSIEREKAKGLGIVSQSNRIKSQMINRAEGMLQGIIDQKGRFNSENTVGIVNVLKAAGANELAKDLSGQWGMTKWYKGTEDVQDVLDALKEYKEAFQGAFAEGGVKDEKKPTPAPTDEGESDIVVKPEDLEVVPGG